MSESKATSTEFDLEALKALQADASQLEHIENLLDRFNVFETIGFVGDELMHSNFLAFLLNPKRNDGLRDLFFKEVLRKTLGSVHKTSPSPVFKGLDRVFKNLDSMDLGQTFVRREHQNIDILLTNETHKLAVIIENKIWSPEQVGQLDKYDRIVRHSHPGWDVLKIFLTPYGDAPSHKEYISFSYEAVCAIVDRILEDRSLTLEPDVKMSMEHYVWMVRRRILGDPEIVSLSQQIYKKHKRAFDLIYTYRPDVQAQIRPIVEDLISKEHPRLKPDDSRKDNIKFVVGEWDNDDDLLTAEGYTASERILIFEVWNNPNSLDVHLYMGPGPEAIRQRLLEMVRANPEVFVEPRSLNPRWLPIFSRHLLKQEAYEDLDEEERKQEIHRQWHEFLDNDLPRIEEALKKGGFGKKSVETYEGH